MLRANLAKILITLHIDKEPLEPLHVPTYARVWHDIPLNKLSVPQTRIPVPIKLTKLKDFFLNYFTSLGGVLRSFKVDENQLTLQVLNMLNKMIKLGFYNNEVELLSICNPVITLLDGSNDFVTVEEEAAYNMFVVKDENQNPKGTREYQPNKMLRYRNNENNSIIFAIKKKIIEILHYIIDIQDDIRLSKFLQEFHKSDQLLMMDPNKSRNEIILLNNIMTGAQLSEKEQELKDQCDKKVIDWMRRAYRNKTVDMKVQS